MEFRVEGHEGCSSFIAVRGAAGAGKSGVQSMVTSAGAQSDVAQMFRLSVNITDWGFALSHWTGHYGSAVCTAIKQNIAV